MSYAPVLSIVTPTLGKFSDCWLESMLKVQGNVQFVFAYPPGIPYRSITDKRVKVVSSPCKGALMQRFTALLNADGKYLINIDDDDFIHPDILKIIEEYFQKHPDSFCMRPKVVGIPFEDTDKLMQPWDPIPPLKSYLDAGKTDFLKPIPIAPLDMPFDRRYLIWPFIKRRDDHGPHIENFNNKVWQSDYVKSALPKISESFKLFGFLNLIPNYGDDRLIGLFIQANSYKPGQMIGHRIPKEMGYQIRFATQDPALKPPRPQFFCDFLLVKTFPQYGYFWNLFFNKFAYLPKIIGKSITWKLRKRTYRGER